MSGLLIDDPIQLQYVLTSNRVIPGDTLWLRDGTYTGDFVVPFAGTQARPITIRSYSGEWAVIDGSLTLGLTDGSKGWLIVRDLEIKNSNTNRGSIDMEPDANFRLAGVTNYAPNSKLINLVVHDTGVSVGDWAMAQGSELYGILAFNSGWMDNLRGHGHALYNQNATGTKTVKHSLMMPHFGRTLACYTTGQNRGFRITENVMLEQSASNMLIGGSDRFDDNEFDSNHVIGGAQFGYLHQQNGSLAVRNNYIWQPADTWSFMLQYFETPTFTGNKICGTSHPTDPAIAESFRWTPPDDTGSMVNVWDSNEYHYLGNREAFKYNGAYKTFVQWQATGFDAAGSYDTSNPTWNTAIYYPNEHADAYSKRLGVAAIWNWAGANTVSLDINGTPDAQVKARNALDYLNDIQTLTVGADGTVTVNMQAINRTIAKPTGWDTALVNSPFPTFGAFVIESV